MVVKYLSRSLYNTLDQRTSKCDSSRYPSRLNGSLFDRGTWNEAIRQRRHYPQSHRIQQIPVRPTPLTTNNKMNTFELVEHCYSCFNSIRMPRLSELVSERKGRGTTIAWRSLKIWWCSTVQNYVRNLAFRGLLNLLLSPRFLIRRVYKVRCRIRG